MSALSVEGTKLCLCTFSRGGLNYVSALSVEVGLNYVSALSVEGD